MPFFGCASVDLELDFQKVKRVHAEHGDGASPNSCHSMVLRREGVATSSVDSAMRTHQGGCREETRRWWFGHLSGQPSSVWPAKGIQGGYTPRVGGPAYGVGKLMSPKISSYSKRARFTVFSQEQGCGRHIGDFGEISCAVSPLTAI